MTAAQSDVGNWSFPNRYTPVGSAVYYAIRFGPEPARHRNALLFAWHQLIMQVAERPNDPGAARLKLDWWRREAGNIQDRKASHPLAIELQKNAHGDHLTTLMGAVIDVAEDEIVRSELLDEDAFVAACRSGLGSIFRLIDPKGASANQELGAYCAAVERIRQLARYPHRVPAQLQGSGPVSTHARIAYVDGLLARVAVTDRATSGSIADFTRRMTALARATQC